MALVILHNAGMITNQPKNDQVVYMVYDSGKWQVAAGCDRVLQIQLGIRS